MPLQTQNKNHLRLTSEVCRAVAHELGAEGVMVTCRARHLCMQMR
ncbi:MAG: hypothetical protein HFG29_07480, partial [Eubacterium sp.]|nr:hypothetical protein [Eubacterium sp.]